MTGWCPSERPPLCHSERSEESSSDYRRAGSERSFVGLRPPQDDKGGRDGRLLHTVMLSPAKHPLPITARRLPHCHTERSEASSSAILQARRKRSFVGLWEKPPQDDRKNAKAPGHPSDGGCPGALLYDHRSARLRGGHPPGSGCQTPPASPAAGHRRSPAARNRRCSRLRPPHR